MGEGTRGERVGGEKIKWFWHDSRACVVRYTGVACRVLGSPTFLHSQPSRAGGGGGHTTQSIDIFRPDSPNSMILANSKY